MTQRLPSVTAKCEGCGGDIVVPIPAPVTEYATDVECPECGAKQRVRTVKQPW